MATRGSYVHNSTVKYIYFFLGGGHPESVSFMQFSQNIGVFRQNESQDFENSYNKQNPFDIYQNYTVAFKLNWARIWNLPVTQHLEILHVHSVPPTILCSENTTLVQASLLYIEISDGGWGGGGGSRGYLKTYPGPIALVGN